MVKELKDMDYSWDKFGQYLMPKFHNETGEKLIAVDIGSHIGGFIDRYKDDFDMIHYYEMNSVAFSKIEEKYSSFDNLVGYNQAVSNYDGLADILYHPNDDSGSLCISNDYEVSNQWEEKIGSVETITFETVLERVGGAIHYLKMDCETSEYSILMNQNLDNVYFLAMELHCQLGEKNWNELLKYILKYFDTYDGKDLKFNGHNKELHFVNKKYLARVD